MAVCTLLAALLGSGVGWLLRGRPAAPDADALDAAARRIADLERELADARRLSGPGEVRYQSHSIPSMS